MADFYKLELEPREAKGSRAAKAVRKDGMVPANYYFHGAENFDVMINQKSLMRALHSGNHIFETHLNNDRQFVMVKEIQFHPVTDEVIHVDFMRVQRNVKTTFSVHIELQGESEGVKEGGVLSQNLTILDINCFPTDVPEYIPIDITNIELNQNLFVSDIPVPKDVEILTPADTLLLSIQPPKVEVEAAEVELDEADEMAEGEADETSGETESEE
ncbi:MAG: 50S ribosomal protein L25 [Simkaniaceae bacterium]|nr:50S ribosomal protein L25 [Simkaniaceae bacterium]